MTTSRLSAKFIDHIRPHIPANSSLEEFIDYCQRPLRRSIRVNTLKISVARFRQRMAAHGWRLTAIPWCAEGFWVERPADQERNIALGNTGEHLLGLFYIQEASSMMPPAALFDGLEQRPARVLDMAAAPGSKTTQLAAGMNNQGLLVANELSSSRLKGLYSNLERCGVVNTGLTHYDGRAFAELVPEQFDAILLDAPCSGEGTVRKDPEALKAWQLERVKELAALQKELLCAALTALKPGGIVVYSTCTLNPYENEQVCQHALAQFAGQVHMEPLTGLFDGASRAETDGGALHIWPQLYDSEGFYVARLRKLASFDLAAPAPARLGRFPFQPASRKTQQALAEYLTRQFSIALPAMALYQRGKELWLFPPELAALIGKLRFDRIGIKVAEDHGRNGFRLEHQFAIGFGGTFGRQVHELDAAAAQQFVRGQDLTGEHYAPGEVLLRVEGWPLGLGKGLRGKLKNSLPRTLVKDNPNFMAKPR